MAEVGEERYEIPSKVQFAYQQGGPYPSHCGYCHSEDEKFMMEAIWSEQMAAQDFQDLVDRGCQRSGKFVYLPSNKITCCPQYVMRLDSTTFHISKQQRRVLRRFNEYLSTGAIAAGKEEQDNDDKTGAGGIEKLTSQERGAGGIEKLTSQERGAGGIEKLTSQERGAGGIEKLTSQERGAGGIEKLTSQERGAGGIEKLTSQERGAGGIEKLTSQERGAGGIEKLTSQERGAEPGDKEKEENHDKTEGTEKQTSTSKKEVTPGHGRDPSKPPPRKAKEIRRERKAIKMAAKLKDREVSVDGIVQAISPSPVPMEIQSLSRKREPTVLSNLIHLPDPNTCKHKLSIKLVCVSPKSVEFESTSAKSYEVFRKFQMIIHKEPEEKCGYEQFIQFCVDSPLQPEPTPPEIGIQYGSYHQQYWIDDKLLMVGVLDIIPKGVLCNYLFYDPEFRFLAPGVFSALHEIMQTQEFNCKNSVMQYYYMGYYVHSCPKMNYKRFYDSSYLLCPETLEYIPLPICRPKLDLESYCTFSDKTVDVKPETGISDVLVTAFPNRPIIRYKEFRVSYGSRCDEQVTQYVNMVGVTLANRMILYFSGLAQAM